jgi:exopolyphosphatase/guanosine-5'-triphosphate,3'-diphosphate pyrophosphatase
VRYRSVQDLIQRFNIDVTHADKVKNTALHCFKQVRKDWGIRKKRKLTLSWAADLHELGLSITHDKHHLQGSHIIEHADIPGFARRRQHWLAVLVNTHRKKLTPEVYETLHEDEREEIRYLSILLRIAVLYHRSRLDEEILPEVEASSDSLHLHLPDNMKNNALLNADLLQEKTWLNKIGFKLYY